MKKMKRILQRILQEIMKENYYIWNIRHLVNETIVSVTQHPAYYIEYCRISSLNTQV